MVDYLIDVCIRFNPLLMMSAIEVMQLLKSWCFFLGLINLIIFCFSQVLGVGILVFLILLFCYFGFHLCWCICCFYSYTKQFDRVELGEIVEIVADLPDPEVLNIPSGYSFLDKIPHSFV